MGFTLLVLLDKILEENLKQFHPDYSREMFVTIDNNGFRLSQDKKTQLVNLNIDPIHHPLHLDNLQGMLKTVVEQKQRQGLRIKIK